jgi:hypothetical protein
MSCKGYTSEQWREHHLDRVRMFVAIARASRDVNERKRCMAGARREKRESIELPSLGM